MQYPYYNWGFLGVNVLMWRVFFPAMGLKPMDNWLRYSVSKLCNVLFTKELQEKISAKGMEDKVISVACHPGYANTNLQNMARDSMSKWEKMNESNSQSAADGSLPLLMATIGKDVKNGQYFGPGDFMEMKGLPKVVKVGGNGNNKKMAKDLWEYSEECVGEKFSI
jgi:NAD(P)-dependent dehydrogenase (short-subunit alcohol dehydrogenase family)